MKKTVFVVIVIISLCIASICSADKKQDGVKSMRDIFADDVKVLSKAPKVYDCPDVQPLGEKALYFNEELTTPEIREKGKESTVRTLYYEGVPFQGKPTKVFAYLGMPKVPEGTKVPGIVLVHGGGGSAFESWVRLWNARGYAAIAMDTCGCIPVGEYGNWQRIAEGGPAGWSGFDQLDWPEKDQWPYQAVSSVILANSLLRAQPGVDKNRIGITGISWGGYLTCIASGLDKRFKFAIPIYGCGYLGDNSAWLPDFERLGPEKAAKWLRCWDPSEYIGGTSTPTLWLTGTNDFAYPMDSLRKSYKLRQNKRALCIRIEMPHGHGGAGENPEEIHAFADMYCNNGTPMAVVTNQGRKDDTAWVEFKSKSPVVKVELTYTTDNGKWPERKWHAIPAEIKGNKASAKLPAGTKVYYMNLTDSKNLLVSSEHTVVE